MVYICESVNELAVVRIDDIVGERASYNIGIYNPNAILNLVDSKGIIQKTELTRMDSSTIWTTYNIQQRHKQLFNLLDSSVVRVVSLNSLLNQSKTINGQYLIYSDHILSSENILNDFSKMSGISK